MGSNKQNRRRGADPSLPRLLGEQLCLDFVNTVEGPRSPHPEDFLHGYPDLVRWACHVSVASDAEVERLLGDGERRSTEAAAVFARAVALREALSRIFHAIARGTVAPESDRRLVQEEYLAGLQRARLEPADGGYRWAWDIDDGALDRPLWPIARSAVDLLTTGELARLKECPGAGDCGWFFYDTSKNGRRRWCSMEGCGSRVKMRRHYSRRRAGTASETVKPV